MAGLSQTAFTFICEDNSVWLVPSRVSLLSAQMQWSVQQTAALVMMRSIGFKECIQMGRKSHEWSFFGRYLGLRVCKTLVMPMKMSMPTNGAPTPIRTCQPAMERPKMSEGRRRKQMIRYKTANQRYLAVRSPKVFAMRIGKRVIGMGYQSIIPAILKKKWDSAICKAKQNK